MPESTTGMCVSDLAAISRKIAAGCRSYACCSADDRNATNIPLSVFLSGMLAAFCTGRAYVVTKSPGAILDNAFGVSPKG